MSRSHNELSGVSKGAMTKLSFAGAVAAFLTAACCVLPMALMLAGLGGAWVAVFGKIAAAGYFVGAAATALMAAAWIVALRRRSAPATFAALVVGAVLIAVSWVVMLNEAAINDYLIALM